MPPLRPLRPLPPQNVAPVIQDAVHILLSALIVAGCLYVIVEFCHMADADKDDEWWTT